MAASHPPYFQMIKEAILALTERTGSSPHAIAKHIEKKHGASLPANYKKILAAQLRGLTAKGKLVKVKASFKLSNTGKKDFMPKSKPKPVSLTPKTTLMQKPKPKAKPAVAKPKNSFPTTASCRRYFEMIKEAIMALKERTGSSPHAIAKHMQEKHGAMLPANYKKLLAMQLHHLTAKGKLVKVKAFFKLSNASKKYSAPRPEPKLLPKHTTKHVQELVKRKNAVFTPGMKWKAPEKKKVAKKAAKLLVGKVEDGPKIILLSIAKKLRTPVKKMVVKKAVKVPIAKTEAKPRTNCSPATKKARNSMIA